MIDRAEQRARVWLAPLRAGSPQFAPLFWLAASALVVALAGVHAGLALLLALGAGVALGWICLQSPPRAAPASAPVAPSAWLARAARLAARQEVALLSAASPLFLFPQRAALSVMLLIPLLAIARWLARGRVTRPSPLNLPIFLLLVMLMPALATADVGAALPKFMGLLLGFGFYFALLNARAVTTPRWAAHALVLLALALTLVGLVGTDWLETKLSLYTSIYAALPKLVRGVPNSLRGGIHPNEMGGALTWLVPFLLGVWLGEQRGHLQLTGGWPRSARVLWHVFLLAAITLSSGLLFLTQSRTAILAVLFALLLLLSFAWKPARWLLGVLAAALLLWLLLAPLASAEWLAPTPIGEVSAATELNFRGRQVLWAQAVELIGRYPLVGIGLNMFDSVRARTEFVTQGPTLKLAAHAHNIYLQAALDFGLPGFIAYSALLVGTLGALWRVMRQAAQAAHRALALALCVGLVAYQLFGLTDAVAFGAKPGFIFWVYVGLSAWLYAQQTRATAWEAA